MKEEGIQGRGNFHLSDTARDYFGTIGIASSQDKLKKESKSGFFPSLIEPYFLCLVMGLIKDKSREPDHMNKDMVGDWVSGAKSFEREISGLVFHRYCTDKGIGEGDDRILKLMESFFETKRSVRIYTIEAYNMMNRYAQGGFDFIQEEIGYVTDLASFLRRYLDQLEGVAAGD